MKLRYLDTSWGLINPSWVAWARVSDCSKTQKPQRTPGNITDDDVTRLLENGREGYATLSHLLLCQMVIWHNRKINLRRIKKLNLLVTVWMTDVVTL